MPLNTYHPALAERLPEWEKILDNLANEDVIKRKTLTRLGNRDSLESYKYIPPLNYKPLDIEAERKYRDYVMRAEFPDLVGRTLKGVLGMLFRRPPTIELPPALAAIQDNIDGQGTRYLPFLRNLVSQLIAPSRVGVLVDVDGAGRAFQTRYDAFNIVKWWVRPHSVTRLPETWRLVLRECLYEPDPKDVDELIEVERFRELRLVSGPPPIVVIGDRQVQLEPAEAPNQQPQRAVFLIHQLWKWDTSGRGQRRRQQLVPDGGPIVIVRQEAVVDFIPFVCMNPESIGYDPEPPLLLGIANTALAMFRNSADLENGRHWTGRPQPFWFGIKQTGTRGGTKAREIEYGSTTVWTTENADAHCGFATFGDQGLASLENGIRTKKESAIEQGARLVEARPAQLTATQSTLKDEADKSIVMTLAETAGNGASEALALHVWWDMPGVTLAAARAATRVKLNPDRGVTLSPEGAKAWAEIQLLHNAVTNRELFDLFKRHGVYDETVTYADHQREIKDDVATQPPIVRATPTGLGPPGAPTGSPARTPERASNTAA